MSGRLLTALARLDPRLFLGGMLLLLALLAVEGWLLVLRKPLTDYRNLAETRGTLASSLGAARSDPGELGRLAAELKQITARLGAQLRPPGADDQVASMVMAELDRAASQNGITLASVRPGARRQVRSFEEVQFEVSAQGRYLQLCQWLMGLERTLGQSATVTEFSMKSADEGRLVALSLKIALYRPMQVAGAAK